MTLVPPVEREDELNTTDRKARERNKKRTKKGEKKEDT
jgi:hypothetical protein